MEDPKEDEQSESVGRYGYGHAASQERSENYVHVSSVSNAEKNPPAALEKIVIRSKNIPKMSDDNNIETTTTKIHVCRVCKKEFSSPQALGGHSKTHSIRFTKEKLPKWIKNPAADQECDDSGKSITCPVFNKDFPSMKSISGHLKCHPERQWRGVHPPPPPSLQNSSLSMVSETTQETVGTLPNSGATDRRGRKRKRIASIAAATSSSSSSSSCLKKEEEREEDKSCSNKRVVNKEILRTNSKPDGYVCSHCKRSFPTGQALGGHIGGHNRMMNRRQVDGGEVGSSSGQSFLQRLTIIEESQSRQEAIFRGDADRRSGVRIFGVDLNEVPEVVDDEEDD